MQAELQLLDLRQLCAQRQQQRPREQLLQVAVNGKLHTVKLWEAAGRGECGKGGTAVVLTTLLHLR